MLSVDKVEGQNMKLASLKHVSLCAFNGEPWCDTLQHKAVCSVCSD